MDIGVFTDMLIYQCIYIYKQYINIFFLCVKETTPPTFFGGDFCHEFHRWTARCQAWTAALSVRNLRKVFFFGVRWDWLPMFHEKNSETMWNNYNFHFQQCNQTWNGLTFLFCEEWSSWVFFCVKLGLTSCARDMMLGSWMGSFLAWTLEDANVTDDVATHELSHLNSEII